MIQATPSSQPWLYIARPRTSHITACSPQSLRRQARLTRCTPRTNMRAVTQVVRHRRTSGRLRALPGTLEHLRWRLPLTFARRRRGVVAWSSLVAGKRFTSWRTIWPSVAPVGHPTLSPSARSGEIAARAIDRAAAERARRVSAQLLSSTDQICASTTGGARSVADNRKACLYVPVTPSRWASESGTDRQPKVAFGLSRRAWRHRLGWDSAGEGDALDQPGGHKCSAQIFFVRAAICAGVIISDGFAVSSVCVELATVLVCWHRTPVTLRVC